METVNKLGRILMVEDDITGGTGEFAGATGTRPRKELARCWQSIRPITSLAGCRSGMKQGSTIRERPDWRVRPTSYLAPLWFNQRDTA
jgi:hypothetical protein